MLYSFAQCLCVSRFVIVIHENTKLHGHTYKLNQVFEHDLFFDVLHSLKVTVQYGYCTTAFDA